MCEIFFIRNMNGNYINTGLFDKLLDKCLDASKINKDGFGLFNNRGTVLRNPDKFKEEHKPQIKELFDQSKFIVIHLRKATHGDSKKRNTHPFKEKSNILVHNGIIYTYSRHAHSKNRTDSYLLLKDLISQKNKDEVKRIEKTLNNITGSFSIFHYTENKNLYYYRNRSSFQFFYDSDKNHVLGATEGTRIEEIYKDNYLNFFKPINTREPEEGIIYKIDSDGITAVSEFETYSMVYSSKNYHWNDGYNQSAKKSRFSDKIKKRKAEREKKISCRYKNSCADYLSDRCFKCPLNSKVETPWKKETQTTLYDQAEWNYPF